MNWRTFKIADLIEEDALIIGDGYRAKNSELSKHGIPFLRAGNIGKGVNFDQVDYFPIEDLSKVGEKMSTPW